MRADVLDSYPALDPARVHVVHNGIDTDFYHPDPARDAVVANGIDPDRPSVVFVGRITRQKGVGHLIAAAHQFDPAAQIVLCAGAPDTPEIAEETEKAVAALSAAALGRRVGARDAADDVRAAGAVGLHGVRLPVGLRAAGDREPGGDGVRHRGGRVATSAASPRSSTTAAPACWCTSTRTRWRSSVPASPHRSTSCSPTRRGRRRWARRAGSGPSASSRGRRPPARTVEIYRSLV